MNSPSHTASHNSNWELLGELELSLNADQNEVIHEWLDQILKSLKLHEDIARRVEVSLQEAGRRAWETHPDRNTQHVHLKIYGSVNLKTGRNWSFFRVEKMEDQSMHEQPSDHAIELYLYLEPR